MQFVSERLYSKLRTRYHKDRLTTQPYSREKRRVGVLGGDMNRFMGKVMMGLACIALMGCGADTEDDTYAADTAASTESGAEAEEEETGAETADENQLSRRRCTVV